jgi:DNA-binding CsgD family transcriptional regulator
MAIDAPFATEAFLLVNAERRIDCVDRTARSVLNLTPRDVLGAPCHQMLALHRADGRPFCAATCPVRSELARGAPSVEHHRLNYRNGRGLMEVCLTAVPLFRPADGGMAILHIVNRSSRCKAVHGDETRREGKQSAPAGTITLDRLTRREREVLGLLAQGRTIGEISETLFIARATIRHHIQHVLEKLEVHQRLHAVAAWMQSASEDSALQL